MTPSERTALADGADLTHLDEHGRPRMVDIVEKDTTRRTAVAQGHIRMSLATLTAIKTGDVRKGDALQVARLAAIMGESVRAISFRSVTNSRALHSRWIWSRTMTFQESSSASKRKFSARPASRWRLSPPCPSAYSPYTTWRNPSIAAW